MATVLGEILHSFFAKLSESDAIDRTTLAALRALLESDNKLKADDFVAVLSGVTEEPPR